MIYCAPNGRTWEVMVAGLDVSCVKSEAYLDRGDQ